MKPYEVICATRGSALSPTQRHVLTHVAMRAGADGECFAAVSTLCDDTGYSTRAVQGALQELVRLGVLIAHPHPGRSTTYAICGEAIPRTSCTPPQQEMHPAPPAPPQEMHTPPAPPAGVPPHLLHPAPAPPADDQNHRIDPGAVGTPPTPQGGAAPPLEDLGVEGAKAELLALQAPEVAPSPRDEALLVAALARGVTAEQLRALWAWSGVSEDPLVAGCRKGGWRRWGSLLRQPQGEARLAAAASWAASRGSSTAAGADTAPVRKPQYRSEEVAAYSIAPPPSRRAAP